MNNTTPITTKQAMQARMILYRHIRDFFAVRQVCEVETPILSPYGSTDVHIDSFVSDWQGQAMYLHTSPEFAMKRLLTDNFGDCFQIAKVFRNEASGGHHLPEFSMLEWYRVGFSMTDLIAEVAELASLLLPCTTATLQTLTYAEAFANIGVNPHRDSIAHLKNTAKTQLGYLPNLEEKRDEWLDFLLVTLIEPQLGYNDNGQGYLTFLTHYPASMAALAKTVVNVDGDSVALRFELYYQGLELANGFHELTNADEQLARFNTDNAQRKVLGKQHIPHDKDFIAALQNGLPDCSGVALGLDRLLMLSLGSNDLEAVTLL